jgi:hypothetical protein
VNAAKVSEFFSELTTEGDAKYVAKFAIPTNAPALSSALRIRIITSGTVRNTSSPAASRIRPPRATIASVASATLDRLGVAVDPEAVAGTGMVAVTAQLPR